MSARTYWVRLLVIMTAAVCLTGCHGGGRRVQQSGNRSTPSAGKPSAASPTLVGPAARCGRPNRPDAHLSTLSGPGGARMPVVDIGRGQTVAVFIHQTDGDGLCGFWPMAAWVTQHFDARAVLFDLCGYGAAQCPSGAFADHQRAQVALAVRHARAAGARRIVLVGASMGGALALASAGDTHADGVVDLSGPADWPDAAAAPAAAELQVPCLMAVSPGDPDASYHDLRSAFTTIHAKPKRFVAGDGAHGWDLLADYNTQPPRWRPLATTVAHWIIGTYR